ncbi:hypothetical protein Ade02nite_76540 [Paractinoplanes deccanensis]|uniref:Zn-dependent protease with MMP-like domain n=1 Tax=Paractinoplanes deccanensis TaxID=113561 RepID=A0ABQ3YG66_9ACTN|nr:metallopeptidase family protein [Actinoplanes deccanensis]GID79013.1 hypothetical protein Ade02nite_76540 [Actinoplanes deccanensis]
MIRRTAHNGCVPVDMSAERFEELVGEALDEVPPELLQMMNNVVIMVEDEPPDGSDDLLGLYEGTALTDRGWDYAGVLPDRITIFRLPTLKICDTETDVIDEVAITVVHEIAHHFGIDDHRLHELGWG